jgi:hypothetical protein
LIYNLNKEGKNMKKLLLMILSGVLLCLAALTAQDITIESVQGTVKYEKSPGVWETLTEKSVIAENTVINTGLNSTLELLFDGKIFTITAMQRGTVKELREKSLAKTGGISLGGSIKKGSLNTDTDQSRTNISTASTRASDATEDIEWAEEEE